MDGCTNESLAQFCISQRHDFAADDWLARGETDGRVVAFAAKYLSMTSWYGHEEELERIAVRLCPRVATVGGLNDELRSVDFDWSHFSTTVRIGIALRLVEQSAPLPGQARHTAAPAGHL
jgi:hypothetical protein